MSNVDTIGFLAGLLFMMSAVPLAVKTVRMGRSDTPWATVVLVSSGSLLMLIYGALIGAVPVVLDMAITLLCWLTVGVVKVRSTSGSSGPEN